MFMTCRCIASHNSYRKDHRFILVVCSVTSIVWPSLPISFPTLWSELAKAFRELPVVAPAQEMTEAGRLVAAVAWQTNINAFVKGTWAGAAMDEGRPSLKQDMLIAVDHIARRTLGVNIDDAMPIVRPTCLTRDQIRMFLRACTMVDISGEIRRARRAWIEHLGAREG
jgi:hypothetical protein